MHYPIKTPISVVGPAITGHRTLEPPKKTFTGKKLNPSHVKHRRLAVSFFFQLEFPCALPHCLADKESTASLVLTVNVEGNFGVQGGSAFKKLRKGSSLPLPS